MAYLTEFPRPDRARDTWLTLNGEWDFKLLENGAGDDTPTGFDKKIDVPFSWAAPLSGIAKNVKGVGWYSRRVAYAPTKRLFLCVGAADYKTDIFVNGLKVLSHEGGYTPFEVELTDIWQSGENEIVIRCEDFRNETQTYGKQGYGDIQGIWQSVWLEERGASYIDSFRFITHLDGSVELTCAVEANDGEIVTAIFDNKEFTGVVNNRRATVDIKIDEPKRWSPDSPYLYEGEIRVSDDVVKTYFGIREVRIQGKRILLNDRIIFINGTLDQAFNHEGHFTYKSDKAMRDEAWRLKRLGLNLVRIHIKLEDPRKLYWMDKLGVMVMQDMPCFWGNPNEIARRAYEEMWPKAFDRDYNHPSIIAWVMFNETWGLFTKDGDKREYLPETQNWVRLVYMAAKLNDKTRIIEDNSPCNNDHVRTDINTWHFYINGYKELRAHLQEVCFNYYAGSEYNFTKGNHQAAEPLMNSECGMVWGVDGSAGDSDISWQYHYMLNEFRLHDEISGFVFTEFHDVVNEFNGYYRIDDKDKDFGYSYYCKGMTVNDLHSQDFLAVDAAPATIAQAGDDIDIPCVLSSFTTKHREKGLKVLWEAWHDTDFGRITDKTGEFDILDYGYGENLVNPIMFTAPSENALEVVSIYLMCEDEIISRNFITFDVQAPNKPNEIEIPVTSGSVSGFDINWTALNGEKLCMGGKGEVSYDIPVPFEPSYMKISMELGAKRVLMKDSGVQADDSEGNFMRGYLVDRGSFPNSYFMTDEDKIESVVEIYVNGQRVNKRMLVGDNADSRGALSWLYQKEVRKLDEAGSYGENVVVDVPSRLITDIASQGKLTLTIKADNGLAVYGRNAGKYPHSIKLTLG